MKRRELLKAQCALPIVAITGGCSLLEPSGTSPRCDQIEAPDSDTAFFEMDVSNAMDESHTLEVRFYEKPSGRLYCGTSVDIAADPEERSRVVREFELETGRYGILIRLEDGRTDWTYWTVDEEGRTVHVAIQDDAMAIGGAQLLD